MKRIWLLIPLILLLSACAEPTMAVPTATVTMEPIVVVPTETASVKPTGTQTPHSTATSTPKSTPTSLPTLSNQDSQKEVTSLINNNGDCKLSCWWGIVPGESTWLDTEQYLVTIADDIILVDQQSLQKYNEKIPLDIYIFYKKVDDYPQQIKVAFSINPEGYIEEIIANEPLTQTNFTISQLLADYGTPEDIKINLQTEFAEGGVYYSIQLFYPEDGFAAIFEGEGEVVKDEMKVCLGDTGPHLHMMSPKGLTLNLLIRIVEQRGWSGSRYLPSIDEFSELNVDSFSASMKDPNGCVYFPLE